MGDLSGNNRKRANTSAFKGLGDKSIRVRDFVGQKDTQDHFKFQFNRRSSLNIALTDLDADANVELLNRKGAVIQASEQPREKSERIQATISADTYYVRVYQGSGNTTYNLTLSAPSDPGDTIKSARKERSPSFTSKNVVGDNDTSDFYQFKIDKSGIFSANLTGLTGDADVRLIDDQNGNGKIDKGEIIAWQWERQKKSESIRKFLKPGNYFLEVKNYNEQSAGYTLKTNFQATKKDDRQFSIKIVYSEALSQFKDTSNMLEEAARFWESAIAHTTLDHVHTLRIFVDTANLPDKVAEGSLTSKDLEKDKNGHVFPVAGTITYDNDSVNQISINRRIAIHEMAYILGLVSVNSGFFDSATSTYKAKSHAGWAYGELLGTYRQTAIPMIGKEYWDYIDFPNEALNASAGPPNGLVSQMTIAALRDIGWNVNYGAADDYLLPVR